MNSKFKESNVASNRPFKLYLGLVMMVFAATVTAGDLNLKTTPQFREFSAAQGERFVFVKKGEDVTFESDQPVDDDNQAVTFDKLEWTFTNGTPDGGNPKITGLGPHTITYGESAVGAENTVKFSSERTVNSETCTTTDKVTCKVILLSLKQENFPDNLGGNNDTTDLGGQSKTEIIEEDGIAYITGAPEMPRLKAELKGLPTGVNVEWKLEITSERSERQQQDDVSYPSTGFESVAGNQPGLFHLQP